MEETKLVTVIHEKPTTKHPIGCYKVVDHKGIYWGHYWVGGNWCNEKYVAEADPRDGLPW